VRELWTFLHLLVGKSRKILLCEQTLFGTLEARLVASRLRPFRSSFSTAREREIPFFGATRPSPSLCFLKRTQSAQHANTPLKLRVTARACDKSRAFSFCTHVLCLLLLFLLVRWESLDERVRVDFFVFFVFEESSSTESQKCTFFLRSRKEER